MALPSTLRLSFPPGSTFEDNVKRLEAHREFSRNDATAKVIKLTNKGGETRVVKAELGSFVSVFFLDWLSRGMRNFTIDEAMHEVVRKFFDPIWNEPNHTTMNFLRESGVRVEMLVVDDGLEHQIDKIWHQGERMHVESAMAVVDEVITGLDYGVFRVAEPDAASLTGWRTNQWLRKAILLVFKTYANKRIAGTGTNSWYDKIPLKCDGWNEADFEQAGFRAVPGSIIRCGAHIESGAILMPSFVGIGARVGARSLIDTGARVGSCAQIGRNVHLSGGAGIGGVLEPVNENPVIIEDGAFIGACSEVVEGVIVRKGAVLSMGVYVGKSTPIVDSVNGTPDRFGVIPENAVILMGPHPSKSFICPHIAKYRDARTDAATALNDVLRDGIKSVLT